MKSLVVFGGVSLFGLSLMLLACGGGSSPAPTAIAYVAHSQNHSVTVVNIPADKTVARIEIGDSSVTSLTQTASYPQRVAFTPDGSRAYVTDGSTSVWAVDTSNKSVIAKIDAGTSPEELAMSPDGKSVYVTAITCGDLLCSGPSKPAQMASVEVIDTASASLRATITFGKTPDVLPSGIAISPDGSRAYVTDVIGGHIWVTDTANNSIAGTITLAGSSLRDVAVSPDGKTLYVLDEKKGIPFNSVDVEVIDTQTNTVTTSIGLGDVPTTIAMTPDGSHAYVPLANGELSVIDTKKNVLVETETISKGNLLLGVAITPDGSRAYVTCGNNNTIYALDTATNRVVDTIRSDYPVGLAIARAR
jgi:YVTN family beta-propeller protein